MTRFHLIVAVLAAVLVGSLAYAGDDYRYTIPLTLADGGCQTVTARTRWAIQCTQSSYIKVTGTPDSGATSDDVRIDANRLYDSPTGKGQTLICAAPETGTGGVCRVYLNRATFE